MDVVIFPINIGNAHWTAAAINLAEKRFEYYDSMGDLTDSRRRIFMVFHSRSRRDFKLIFTQNLRAYLDAEHRDKKAKPFDFTGWHDAFDVVSFLLRLGGIS
jgi:sentrin-specific protease 1